MKLGSLMIKRAQEARPAVAAANRRNVDRLSRRLRGERQDDGEAQGEAQPGGVPSWLDNVSEILPQLIDKIMSSEAGRSIVEMILPQFAQSWRAGREGGDGPGALEEGAPAGMSAGGGGVGATRGCQPFGTVCSWRRRPAPRRDAGKATHGSPGG